MVDRSPFLYGSFSFAIAVHLFLCRFFYAVTTTLFECGPFFLLLKTSIPFVLVSSSTQRQSTRSIGRQHFFNNRFRGHWTVWMSISSFVLSVIVHDRSNGPVSAKLSKRLIYFISSPCSITSGHGFFFPEIIGRIFYIIFDWPNIGGTFFCFFFVQLHPSRGTGHQNGPILRIKNQIKRNKRGPPPQKQKKTKNKNHTPCPSPVLVLLRIQWTRSSWRPKKKEEKIR